MTMNINLSSYFSKRNLIAVLCGLTLLNSSPAGAFAAEGTKNQKQTVKTAENIVGYVDLATILSFHPYMNYYSFETGTFIKPIDNTGSKSDFLKQISERQQKNKVLKENQNAMQVKLNDEVKIIEDELSKIRVKISREQSVLNQKFSEEYTKLPDEKSRKMRLEKYHKDLSVLEDNFYKERKSMEEQKEKALNQIKEIHDDVNKVDYMTKKDSQAFFAEIISEINEAIKQAAAEKKVGFVLNSNYISVFTPAPAVNSSNFSAENTRVYSAQQEMNMPAANYAPIINAFEEVNGNDATSENGIQKTSIEENCKKIFDNRVEFVKVFAQNSVLNQLVVCGGQDLTVDVIKLILEKHNTSKKKQEIIINKLNILLKEAGEDKIFK